MNKNNVDVNAMKTNPRKLPATQADVKRARKEGQEFGTRMATVLFLSVLLDKEGADGEIIRRVWNEINDLAQSVVDGYVNLHDLRKVLLDEYEIEV